MATPASESVSSRPRSVLSDIQNFQGPPTKKRFKQSPEDDSKEAPSSTPSTTEKSSLVSSSSVAQVPSAVSVAAGSASSPEEPMYWRRLFQDLQRQRVTEAERLLHEFMAASEKREQTLKRYIRGLEEDLGRAEQTIQNNSKQVHTSVELQHEIDKTKQEAEDLRKQLREAKATIAQKSGLLQGVNHQLQTQQEETAGLKDVLADTKLKLESAKRTSCFAQLMMGCSLLEVAADGRNTFDCTMMNDETNVSTTFRLTDHTTHMNYSPLINPDPLPDFLHASIDFDHNQLPALVQNGLRSIFPEED